MQVIILKNKFITAQLPYSNNNSKCNSLAKVAQGKSIKITPASCVIFLEALNIK
jgi:hypothetical protein